MKGYEFSTDYNKLWALIQEGYRVPAWINNPAFESDIIDLVEVKLLPNLQEPYIGSRGKSYSGPDETLKGFIECCQWLNLQFIVPNK